MRNLVRCVDNTLRYRIETSTARATVKGDSIEPFSQSSHGCPFWPRKSSKNRVNPFLSGKAANGLRYPKFEESSAQYVSPGEPHRHTAH